MTLGPSLPLSSGQSRTAERKGMLCNDLSHGVNIYRHGRGTEHREVTSACVGERGMACVQSRPLAKTPSHLFRPIWRSDSAHCSHCQVAE